MKRLFFLLLTVICFSSCDDGELTLESFNFEDQIIQKCTDPNSFLIFKIKSDELLLVSFPEAVFNEIFHSDPMPINTVREYTINASNQVVYRKYSGTVANSTVCATIPAASPVVSKEWTATGGTISIITTEVFNTDNELTGYTHNITFYNINFSSSDNSFSFESYLYGDYEVDL